MRRRGDRGVPRSQAQDRREKVWVRRGPISERLRAPMEPHAETRENGPCRQDQRLRRADVERLRVAREPLGLLRAVLDAGLLMRSDGPVAVRGRTRRMRVMRARSGRGVMGGAGATLGEDAEGELGSQQGHDQQGESSHVTPTVGLVSVSVRALPHMRRARRRGSSPLARRAAVRSSWSYCAFFASSSWSFARSSYSFAIASSCC